MDSLTTAALERLRALTDDPAAEFRDDQLEAITDLVADRDRVLCVQRTGWGKSAVYFVATSLLRDPPAGADRAASGPTLIISPLLALMRNQLAAAGRLGLAAHTVNSTNREEWDEVRDRLAGDDLDLLLISPERLNNPRFRDEMLPLFAASLGLLVIDEAHCISDWGHDFRPDYRRVGEMLAALGARDRIPVLATTATANDRVVADVTEQLSASDPSRGSSLRSYRGPLARASLRLEVVELSRPAERLAWLVEHLPSLDGSGIVYTLTKRDADQVAEFLNVNGITALAYSGDQDSDARVSTEQRLLGNEVKAVVATSALGMGYDKPDLGFVVHYQAPGSVVAYYQQVGRAGRGVEHADVVLLRGQEDRRIQDFFIEQSFPSRERVQAVLAELRSAAPQGRTTRELMAVVNLGMARLEAMLKILDVEGAVARDGTRWTLAPSADEWEYDAERYAHVTALRRAEQEAMARYGADGRCLMRVLQEQLDDPDPADCGRCAVCTGARFADPPAARLVELAGRHLRSRPIELEVKKMAPDAHGAMRKIPEDARTEPGWALARFGDGGWWPAIARGLSEGAFDEEVVQGLADVVRAQAPAARWMCAVPSARLGDTLEVLAGRVAGALGLPCPTLVARTGPRPPQREMENAVSQAANVRGAFRVVATPPRGTGVLLDDRRSSGWTLAMVGGQLRRAGAERVVPLALGTLL
ncbi:MAG TPA: RecQ family ATP-dependent DNA helicase [Solirubrobacteraceae bacterium]|nr:RecQ family ATP-dependent DNA helicase [Solirubrobacteraceae bacterium]